METYVICPDSSSDNNNNKYKGVRKRKWGKYVSEIRLPNSRERIWLGSFDSPEKAARAFDAALFCLRGPAASFNFPQHPPNIPGGGSLSPSEIQAVAARFANQEPLMPPQQQPLLRDEIDVSEEEVENGSGDNTTMDWSFLETLDNDVGSSPSEFGYSFGSDLMYYHTDQPASPSSYGLHEDGGIFVDDYSHHYSLWNFN